MKEKIPRIGIIDQNKLNHHEFYYQCSKYVTYFLFGNLMIRYSKDEPYFPAKSNQYHLKLKWTQCLLQIIQQQKLNTIWIYTRLCERTIEWRQIVIPGLNEYVKHIHTIRYDDYIITGIFFRI